MTREHARSRSRSWLARLVLAAALLALAAPLPRLVLSASGGHRATQVLETLPPGSSEADTLEALARWAATRFRVRHNTDPISLLARAAPYLANRRLPDWLRVPPGAIELTDGSGLCDSQSRMLGYLLDAAGIDSQQWNMAVPGDLHTALVATLGDGQRVLVDPYLGVMARGPDGFLSPESLAEMVAAGADPRTLLVSLRADSTPDWYEKLGGGAQGAQGEPLVIDFQLPPTYGQVLTLGDLDGSSKDVEHELALQNLSLVYTYLGSRYDPGWTRVLTAREPVTLAFTTVIPPDPAVFTFDREPEIQGNTLRWRLDTGERLRFVDGDAGIIWRRGVSYIDIDRIEVLPTVTD